MKNREIFMGFILLIITMFLFFIANSYDQRKALELKKNEEDIPTEEVIDSVFEYYDNERIIIIGDSRMYGASQVIDDKDVIFIAKNGARCNYLWETAEKETDRLIEDNPGEHFTILFNLGVNDLDNIAQGKDADGETICDMELYSAYYKHLKEKWEEHNLFFISVNPVNENILKTGKFKDSKMTNNEEIKEFNESLEKDLEKVGIYYCDTYTSLIENGFESPDGLHYSDDTSKKIISMIKECSQTTKEEKMKKENPILSISEHFKDIVKKEA